MVYRLPSTSWPSITLLPKSWTCIGGGWNGGGAAPGDGIPGSCGGAAGGAGCMGMMRASLVT